LFNDVKFLYIKSEVKYIFPVIKQYVFYVYILSIKYTLKMNL